MKQEHIDQYSKLGFYAASRTRELSKMLQPYLEVTDRYGQLMCGVVTALGQRPPASRQEACLRDLTADVFDFLYESRPLIVKGKLEIAYPLARRAYESLSLMVACAADASLADKWQRGARISNADVRAILGKQPMGENEDDLKGLYKFFSEATHPNRSTVAGRQLGEGNLFVLGSIGLPSLVLLAEFAIKTLGLWFWFAAFSVYTHRELLAATEPELVASYMDIAETAQAVSKWLAEQFDRVLAEEQAHAARDPYFHTEEKPSRSG
jgi:hypothetical protein